MRLSSAILFSTFSAAASFMTPLPNTSSNTKSTSLFASTEVKPLGIPGTAKLDKPWKELGFEFRPTKSNLRITHKNGEWGEFEMCEVRLIFRQDSISVTHDERNIFHFYIIKMLITPTTHHHGTAPIFNIFQYSPNLTFLLMTLIRINSSAYTLERLLFIMGRLVLRV